jgi:hypothetical protein
MHIQLGKDMKDMSYGIYTPYSWVDRIYFYYYT